MTSAELLASVAEALKKKAKELGAGFATAGTRFDALSWLFDGPAGFGICVWPGGETVESQEEDLTVVEAVVGVTVGHRMPPTSDPGEGLWHGVGKGEAFLAVVDAVRLAVQAVELPEGETSGFWRYRGRTETELEGAPMPAFELRFCCDVSVDAGTGEAAWIAGDENPDDDDLEEPTQENEA